MSIQTLLCVSKNDDHAASALKQIIPSMERGFNINAVHGELAIGGEDAKAITRLLTKLLSDRLAKNQSKSVETQARPDLKKSLVALKSLLAFAIRDWPKYLGTGQAVLQFNGHCFWYSSLEGATIGVTLPGQVAGDAIQITAKTIKSALLARPGKLTVDWVESTINGVKFDPAFRLDPEVTPLDVNRQFAKAKTILTVPLPTEIQGVRMAEAQDDVRFYLNGLCFDLSNHALVATNGHRLHVANSSTLPNFDSDLLNELLPDAKEGKHRLILASWQIQLLNVIGASNVQLGRFLDLPKDMKHLGGWRHPEAGSMELLVRAQGTHGFLVCKSVQGSFPDWQRVVRSPENMLSQREAVLSIAKSIKASLAIGEKVKDTTLAWAAAYPRTVRIGEGVADDLRRFIRAEKASESSIRENPLVVVDLKRGRIHSVQGSSIPLNIEIPVLDQFDYPPERETDHILGVQASYLADAIEYLGTTEWFISKSIITGHQGSRSAVVMPCNL
jgi:hypothetical protein